MPIYDYVCANGHTTEVIHGVNDSGPANCPVCGAPLRKALSAPAIVFKGSGWAKNERSSKSPSANSGEADKSAASTAPAGESAKTESSKPSASATPEA